MMVNQMVVEKEKRPRHSPAIPHCGFPAWPARFPGFENRALAGNKGMPGCGAPGVSNHRTDRSIARRLQPVLPQSQVMCRWPLFT